MRDLAWIIADNKKAQEAHSQGRLYYSEAEKDKAQDAYTSKQLYSDQHILNRTEAWDRLDYWINEATGNETYHLSVIRILGKLLRNDEEGKLEPQGYRESIKEENAAKTFEDVDLLDAQPDYHEEEDYYDFPENWDFLDDFNDGN